MHKAFRRTLAATTIGAAATLGATATAHAQGAPISHRPLSPQVRHAVFVQTDDPAGNAIDVFAAHRDGRLSLSDVVDTGGLGGQAAGSAADHLASQGSLVYDNERGLLFAVNAGSDSVSVLSVHGRQVRLIQVIGSGGDFPSSIAVRGDLVYVLDAGGSGTVAGYRIFGDRLWSLPGSARSLGLANSAIPNFLTAPGQVGFSPDGSELLVTTKASTSSLDVFAVNPAGFLSSTPTVTADPGNVPFAFVDSPTGQLVVGEAATSALHTYAFGPGRQLTSISSSIPDGQGALCWITTAGQYYYVANAASNDVSAYTVTSGGTPTLLDPTGVAATTDGGPIDLASSADGDTLYVEAGAAGAVDEFHVGAGGSLTDLGTVAGLGAGIEGIATE